MSRAVHFEIQGSQPQVLIDFYSALFGWRFNQWKDGQYWMINTGPADQPGIDGGLLPRPGPPPADMQPVNGFVCTIDVDALDRLLAQAAELGGSTVVPKMPIPGIGWLAYAKDPDGNIFGMMQADITAA
jgi:uncharacterized protein